jgi:hypothetical protein
MRALITKINKPRVRMVMGIVRIISIGFRIALNTESTIATRIACR